MSAQIAAQVEKMIVTRIQSDRLDLPCTPAVAQRCQALTREPTLNMKKVVALLEKDVILAARVLRESAAYGRGTTASMNLAANRLGPQKLRNLLLEASGRELYTSPDRRINAQAAEIWRHALAVGIVARDLATFTGASIEADSAYLVGLLHDLGKTLVATVLLEVERAMGKRGQWMTVYDWWRVVEALHRPLGLALAEKWELPFAVVATIKDSADYDRAEQGNSGNFARFANAVAKREGISPGEVDQVECDTLIMIGRSMLSVEDDVLTRVSHGLADRVTAAMQV